VARGQTCLVLAITRLRYDDLAPQATIEELDAVLRALRGCPGFRNGAVGRAMDDEHLWVIQSSWDSVGGYRRALSSYPVKMALGPLMARVVDEPSAFEVLAVVGSSADSTAGSSGVEPDGDKPNESRPRGAVP
jgi:heme oxygenase (mycobilin-producing)